MFALGFKRLIFMSFRHSGITLSLVGDLGSLLNSEIKFCSGWRKRPSNKPITVLQFEERIMRLTHLLTGEVLHVITIYVTLLFSKLIPSRVQMQRSW